MKTSLNKLHDKTLKAARPESQPYRLRDGGGLALVVTPRGVKRWEFSYTRPTTGKRNTVSLGQNGQAATYPEISLDRARDRAIDLRRMVQEGIDPGEAKVLAKEAKQNSFQVFSVEWMLKQRAGWTEEYADLVKGRLYRHVLPFIGSMPINEITVPDMKKVLDRIEAGGRMDTAGRVRKYCSKIFRLAIASGKTTFDPADIVADAMGAKPRTKHHAAITQPDPLAGLLRAIDGYSGNFLTKSALQLLPLVFVRPGELRQAVWSEFDLENAEWSIPSERMKMKEAHLVPLSRQALTLLRDLYQLTGPGGLMESQAGYVFPGFRSVERPMSENTVNAALRALGYDKDTQTGHGFRATARTLLDEVLKVRVDYIEHQLAHAVKDPNGRAYNRTAFIIERAEMMQKWADYLDRLKNGESNIRELRRVA